MLKVHKLLGSDLITISIITFIICLILTIGTLYLTQPNWVHTMNMKKGTPELSWLLVFVYSFAFASFAAIIVMTVTNAKLHKLNSNTK